MSFESVRSAVATYVGAQMASLAPGTKVEFENVNEIDHNAQTAAFVTFAMHWREATQASLENVPITRYDGEGLFHIHVPGGKGTKTGLQIADTLASIMKYARISNVQFFTPRLLPPGDFNGWLIYPLSFSFFYRE